MVHESITASSRQLQRVGTRVLLSRAAERLRRAFRKRATTHDALRATIMELELEIVANEARYQDTIQSMTADADNKRMAVREEITALNEQIVVLKDALEQQRKTSSGRRVDIARCDGAVKPEPHPRCMEALLSAEVKVLQQSLDLIKSELAKERKTVAQLRQAKADLPAALQQARAAQTTADSLVAELQRKLSDKATLLEKNRQLEEAIAQMKIGVQKSHSSLHVGQYKVKHKTSPRSCYNRVTSCFEKTMLNLTHMENVVPGSTSMTGCFDNLSILPTSYHYSGERPSPNGSSESGFSEKSDNWETSTQIDFLVDSLRKSLNIKGIVVKNNSVCWFVEIIKRIKLN